MRDDRENIIVTKTIEFSLKIMNFTEELNQLKKFNLSRQLFDSGTSIGANVREAQNAESKADFVHKMKVAAEEADETEYWLTLCNRSKHYPDCLELLTEVSGIMKILSKIISSSKD